MEDKWWAQFKYTVGSHQDLGCQTSTGAVNTDDGSMRWLASLDFIFIFFWPLLLVCSPISKKDFSTYGQAWPPGNFQNDLNETRVTLLKRLTGWAAGENETPSRRCVPDSWMPGSCETKREDRWDFVCVFLAFYRWLFCAILPQPV